MRILLATLATPTETSELYEFTIGELANLYPTKAFAGDDAEDKAIAWAEALIEEQYHEYLDSDEPRYERTGGDFHGFLPEEVPFRQVLWSNGPEALPHESFALSLHWQEVGA